VLMDLFELIGLGHVITRHSWESSTISFNIRFRSCDVPGSGHLASGGFVACWLVEMFDVNVKMKERRTVL
jgi:hypothetical protein